MEACLQGIILWPGPSAIDIILKVPAVDELFNFILKRDTLFRSVTNVLVVSTIFVLIPLGTVSTQWVMPFEQSSLFCYHENVLSR